MNKQESATVFQPPLILAAHSRGIGPLLLDAALTLLLWLAWAYLFLAAIGYFWVPSFAQMLIPVTLPDDRERVLLLTEFSIVLAMSICLMLLFRMRLDRWRFSGADRRRSMAMPSIEAQALDFGVQPGQLRLWTAARRLVIHHDETGGILRVDMMEGRLRGTAEPLFDEAPRPHPSNDGRLGRLA